MRVGVDLGVGGGGFINAEHFGSKVFACVGKDI